MSKPTGSSEPRASFRLNCWPRGPILPLIRAGCSGALLPRVLGIGPSWAGFSCRCWVEKKFVDQGEDSFQQWPSKSQRLVGNLSNRTVPELKS